MQYDKENRLVLSQEAAQTSTYQYSGDGLKRVEIVSGAVTTLVWDGTDYLQGVS